MTRDLGALVAGLPELYQPVFAHPEFDARAARASDDRLALLKTIYETLVTRLQRPLRVLDLGSAQGYFSLHVAALGAEVVGVEACEGNVQLSQALAEEQPALNVTFAHIRLEDWLRSNALAGFDLVLAFSVLHHTCHAMGEAAAREIVKELARNVPVALIEMARADEPLSWAASLPANPRALLADFPFVHRVGAFGTHLSSLLRPMYFCSARYWYLGGRLDEFATWTDRQHEAARDVFRGSRRYYFSRAKIAKHFLLDPVLAETNWRELEAEAALLSGARDAMPGLPAYEAWSLEEDAAWLVRELLPGRRLSECILSGASIDIASIVRDVLSQLRSLEEHGLYHSDVRVWNVLLLDTGVAALIDFGSITGERRDCSWPLDPHLAFLLFVRELAESRVPRAYPTRPPIWYSADLEGPLGRWFEAALAMPRRERTFARLARLLEDADSIPNADSRDDALRFWRAAIERNLDVVGEELAAVRQWIELDWFSRPGEPSAAPLERAGSRPLPSIVAQLSALGGALTRVGEQAEAASRSVERIEAQVRSASTVQEQIQPKIEDLRALTADLVVATERLNAFTAKLEIDQLAGVSRVAGQLRELSERIERGSSAARSAAGQVEARLTNQMAGMARLQSDLHELSDRSARIEHESAAMRATTGWKMLTPWTSFKRWRESRQRRH
jgi:O-antigen chain-terminating methyltransferase